MAIVQKMERQHRCEQQWWVALDFIRLSTLYAKSFGFLCPKFSIEMCWWKSSQRGSSPSMGDSEQRLRHVRLFPQHSCHHQLPGDRQRKKPTLARLPGRGRKTKWRGRASGSEEAPICSSPPDSDCARPSVLWSPSIIYETLALRVINWNR